MPRVLMLVRHAESADGPLRSKLFEELRPSGMSRFHDEFERRRSPNPGLSELGRRQAKALAKSLAPDLLEDECGGALLVTSPMLCAMETALPAARRGQLPRERFVCHPELFDVGSGFLNGERRPSAIAAELEAEFGVTCCEVPADADYPERDGGEDGEAASARVVRTWTWLESVLESGVYMSVVVIAHGHLISRWLQLLGGDQHGRLAFAHHNAAISLLTWWEGEGAVLEHLNQSEHLFDCMARNSDQPFRYLEPLTKR